ncbi:MAG: conjugal transfer protein TraD [Candidatus Levybacteria bacterium]|jgi:hypothetical protein|nr:conjugal transfer protein TraD [Candidatus Levybacteria bacterium]
MLEKNYFQRKYAKSNDQDRRARTRTLIQLGGLLNVAKLLEEFGINIGDDLQQDFDANENAAKLLGFLLDAKVTLMDENNPQFSRWIEMGKNRMLMHQYQETEKSQN